MVLCQFEGADSKSDECQTRNLEHFSQIAKIQNGRQNGRQNMKMSIPMVFLRLFWWFLVNLRVLIPNPMSASRETSRILRKSLKFKMAAKMAAKTGNQYSKGISGVVLVVSYQFEGADSKFDECQPRNPTYFTQIAKIQNGCQNSRQN